MLGISQLFARADEAPKTIKICSQHQDYQVPLIWTFAFIGAEYWCPHCGNTSGMMGAGESVPITPELVALLQTFTRLSHPYLHARAWTGLSGAQAVKHNGEWVRPADLPADVLARHEAAVQAWQYHQKPELDPLQEPEAPHGNS
jgi:hypothetical protein